MSENSTPETAPFLYSKSMRCMYLAGLHTNLPADAVPVTAAEHDALMKGQADGKEIVPDANGRPVLHEPPKPTAEDVANAAQS